MCACFHLSGNANIETPFCVLKCVLECTCVSQPLRPQQLRSLMRKRWLPLSRAALGGTPAARRVSWHRLRGFWHITVMALSNVRALLQGAVAGCRGIVTRRSVASWCVAVPLCGCVVALH